MDQTDLRDKKAVLMAGLRVGDRALHLARPEEEVVNILRKSREKF